MVFKGSACAGPFLMGNLGKVYCNHFMCGSEQTLRNAMGTMSKRVVYIEKMKKQLDELNAKMDKLETKTQDAKIDARARYKEELGKLRKQSKRAVAKLEEIQLVGEDKWEGMVTEMEKVRDAFKHSFNYFKSQL